MSFANLAIDFGIAVREAALAERGVTISQLLAIFEVEHPLDHEGGVITFGPHFGQEAADNLTAMLNDVGLETVDDFFVFSTLMPQWCEIGVRIAADG